MLSLIVRDACAESSDEVEPSSEDVHAECVCLLDVVGDPFATLRSVVAISPVGVMSDA